MRSTLYRGILVLLLLVLVAAGAIPHYLQGNWSGGKRVFVHNLANIRKASTQGLTLTGWQTVKTETVSMGGESWLQQILQPLNPTSSSRPITLLLRGQKNHDSRPQVEWTDIAGQQQWYEDHQTTLTLGNAEARWFRAWKQLKDGNAPTVAGLQWYAWPEGGSWSPNVWFWQDWTSRWRGKRIPWIAISVIMPMEPLGNLRDIQPQATAVMEAIQTALRPFWEDAPQSS
jgi:cyanoexosortase B-associated protein